MIFRVASYQSDPVIDSSLTGSGKRMRYRALLLVYAHTRCVRGDLENPYQQFCPSAADVYHCAAEVGRNEVDQFRSALFGKRSHEREIAMKRSQVGPHALNNVPGWRLTSDQQQDADKNEYERPPLMKKGTEPRNPAEIGRKKKNAQHDEDQGTNAGSE